MLRKSNWEENETRPAAHGASAKLLNPGFNPIEFDGIRKLAGLNSFVLTNLESLICAA